MRKSLHVTKCFKSSPFPLNCNLPFDVREENNGFRGIPRCTIGEMNLRLALKCIREWPGGERMEHSSKELGETKQNFIKR